MRKIEIEGLQRATKRLAQRIGGGNFRRVFLMVLNLNLKFLGSPPPHTPPLTGFRNICGKYEEICEKYKGII